MRETIYRRRWAIALAILIAFVVYGRFTHEPAHHDLPLVYSDHALERLEQRGISPEQVEAVIRQGNWRPGKVAGRFESVLAVDNPAQPAGPRRIRVVFAREQDHIVVITVMNDEL